MGFFSDYFAGVRELPNYINFADDMKSKADPKTGLAKDAFTYKRPKRIELEEIYRTDSQTFGSINKTKQLITGARSNIVAKDISAQKEYDDFFDEIGNIGIPLSREDLDDSILHDMFVFGHAYVERVLNHAEDKILDFKMVDAKLIDYARDEDGNIFLDESQRPVGYVMTVGEYTKYMGDQIPRGVSVHGDQIFLNAARIAHFKCFSFGNRFEALGFVETSYVDIRRKHWIEESATNSIYNNMHKHIIGYVGSETRMVGEQQRKSVLDSLRNLSYNRYAVFTMPTKIETLDADLSDQTTTVLDYLRINQSASSGVPIGLSLGSGEAINRSVLHVQQRLLYLTANAMAKSYAVQFKREILDWLYKYNKYSSKAELVIEDINVEDKNAKTSRLSTHIQNKVICPQEARPYVLEAEKITPLDKEYEKFLHEAEERNTKEINDKEKKNI